MRTLLVFAALDTPHLGQEHLFLVGLYLPANDTQSLT